MREREKESKTKKCYHFNEQRNKECKRERGSYLGEPETHTHTHTH